MTELKFKIPDDCEGVSVQRFLRQHEGFSSRMVVRLKHTENGITVNGELRRTIDWLHAGEILVLRFPQESVYYEKISMPIDVRFEDEHVLVVNKPPFLAVHPSAGKPDPTLANAVAAHYESRGESHAFHPVNRLDRNTSGLLVAAKTSHIAYALTGKCEKKYYAIVLGKLEGEGTISQPIRIKEGSCITREIGEGGKESITHWRSLKSCDEVSLIELWLETGRTHQIRVHMSWLGYPLVGDTLYGEDEVILNRHALHCYFMQFDHPITGEKVQIESNIPDDMQQVLNRYFR